MRDPLSRVPVRFKLPLTLAVLGGVAFMFGAYAASLESAEATTGGGGMGGRVALVIGALAAATLAILFCTRRFLLQPLARLAEAARRFARGEFGARVEHASRDEIGDLAAAFNVMAAAIEERTRRAEQAAEHLRRREAEFRFERDRLDTVIRSMEDGLFILDGQDQVTLSNAAARPVVAALAREPGAMAPLLCDRRRADGDAVCRDCVRDFSQQPLSCVVTVDSRVYEIHGASLPGPDRAVAGRVYVSRDVTERLREIERQTHQERLSVLGEVGAVMAHELNNPLAAISMFSQMLLDSAEAGSPARAHAEVIRRNTESCKRMIRSLLDMAATAAPEHGEVDLWETLAEVAQFLQPVARRAGARILVEPTAGDAVVRGDGLQLRQVVVNLVMNAVQAAEPPGVVITLTVEPRGDEVAVRVVDTGPGVPAAVAPRIFEPFFSTKPPGVGTGLGLPTSRRIALAHGGRLALLESRPGRTVFEALLPRRAVEPPWVPPGAVATGAGTGSGTAARPGSLVEAAAQRRAAREQAPV